MAKQVDLIAQSIHTLQMVLAAEALHLALLPDRLITNSLPSETVAKVAGKWEIAVGVPSGEDARTR